MLHKTYNCCGRLISIVEDLTTAPEHFLTALERFHNYSVALTTCSGIPIFAIFVEVPEHYGSVLVSWCAKIVTSYLLRRIYRHYGRLINVRNCSVALINCFGRFINVPKTYKCSGRHIIALEDLLTAPKHLLTAPKHLLNAPEQFSYGIW